MTTVFLHNTPQFESTPMYLILLLGSSLSLSIYLCFSLSEAEGEQRCKYPFSTDEEFNHTASQWQSLGSDPVSPPYQRPWLGGNFHCSGFIQMSEKTLGCVSAQREYKHNFIWHWEIGQAL